MAAHGACGAQRGRAGRRRKTAIRRAARGLTRYRQTQLLRRLRVIRHELPAGISLEQRQEPALVRHTAAGTSQRLAFDNVQDPLAQPIFIHTLWKAHIQLAFCVRRDGIHGNAALHGPYIGGHAHAFIGQGMKVNDFPGHGLDRAGALVMGHARVSSHTVHFTIDTACALALAHAISAGPPRLGIQDRRGSLGHL